MEEYIYKFKDSENARGILNLIKIQLCTLRLLKGSMFNIWQLTGYMTFIWNFLGTILFVSDLFLFFKKKEKRTKRRNRSPVFDFCNKYREKGIYLNYCLIKMNEIDESSQYVIVICLQVVKYTLL